MPRLAQAQRHVAAHLAQPDHANTHRAPHFLNVFDSLACIIARIAPITNLQGQSRWANPGAVDGAQNYTDSA
jgi:hypothetical protein